jgi:hypothetical protein
MQHLSAGTRRVLASTRFTENRFFCVWDGFFSVLLNRCVISFGADHLYSVAVY